jgi:signal transduction histidine kinase
MLAVSFIPLSILALQGLHCARQAVIELQTNHLRNVLDLLAERIDWWVDERKGEISLLAGTGVIQDLLTSENDDLTKFRLKELLKNLGRSSEFYDIIVVYDKKWNRVIQSGKPSHADEDLLTDEFKNQLDESNGFVTSPFHSHDNGEIGLHMGYPLFNDEIEKTGYIAVNLNLNDIVQSTLACFDPDVNPAHKVYLLSQDGTYLSIGDDNSSYLGKKSNVHESILDPDGNQVASYRDYRGIKVLGMSVKIPDMEWIIVAEVERDKAFSWVRRLIFRAIVTAIITILLTSVIALKISGKISKPISELAKLAHRVAAGQTLERMQPSGDAETKELADAFNHMLDQLAVMHKELIQTAALAAVGELSASVVHEMRNPLATIKMNVRALQKKVDNDPDYSELGQLAFIQAERLELMLNDLLNYGKRIRPQITELRLEELFSEVKAAIQPQVDGKIIDINVEIGQGAESIAADHEQIKRALVNLVDNAVDACDGDGLITISSRLDGEGGRFVSITVSDNGRGLPANAEKEIFRPFYTTRDLGTGLGLAIVAKIVDMHGGAVEARNRPNGGAEFTIKLPSIPDSLGQEQPMKIDQGNGSTGT